MTSINDILKPKSKEDLSKDIQKMSSFDFIYMIRRRRQEKNTLNGLKIGFKKRILYLLLVKSHSKFYPILGGMVFGLLFGFYLSVSEKIKEIFLLCGFFIFAIQIMSILLNLLVMFWESRKETKKLRELMDDLNDINQ